MTHFLGISASVRRVRPRQRPSRARAGFSLVEIVVAMMLLSVTLLALAALMTQVAQQARATEITSQRTALLTQHINYFTSVSYTALTPALSGCLLLDEATMPHQRCVEITQAGTARTVKIRITPSNRAYRPDSAMLRRTEPPINYFNIGQ